MRRISFWIFVFLSLGVAGYAAVSYSVFPLGSLVHPDMETSFNQHAFAVYLHVFASLIALSLGPFQFSRSIRQNHENAHRICGRVYLFAGVLLGGISGLYIAQFAFGGFIAVSGFSVLAILWISTGAAAFLAIKRGDHRRHKIWMIRNMSLTFAAVTLRIYLGTFSATGIEFRLFYPWLGWACWVPNLVIAEFILIRASHRFSRNFI